MKRWCWLLLLVACSRNAPPSVPVERGEFLVEVSTRGELKAVNSRTVARAREGWSQAAIVRMVPEGERVEEGDFLVQFDASEAERQLQEKQSGLQTALATLEAARAQATSRMAELQSGLKTQEYTFEQARIRLGQMQYEAEARRREQTLELRKAELALQEARERIESQRTVDRATLRQNEIAVEQARAEVQRAQKVLQAQTLVAPIGGLVVYQTIWKMGSRGKVAVGDTPWPGQEILEIPDLSSMKVLTRVDEAQVHRVAVGQPVRVRVDALEDLELVGEVSRVATLATEERGSNAKFFELEVLLTTHDERLRPGMSVGCAIETARLAEVVHVPLDALFERDGRTVVFVEGDGDPRAVELGARNDDRVVVTEGLEPGERIYLRDPRSALPEVGELPETESPAEAP